MRRYRGWALCIYGLVVVALLLALGPASSFATLPGQNGPLLVTSELRSRAEPGNARLFTRIGLLHENRGLRWLLDGPADFRTPALAPHGKRIAFVRNPGDQLWVGPRSDLANSAQISNRGLVDEDGYVSAPVFSPDGKFVFYGNSGIEPDYPLNEDSEIVSYSFAARKRQALTDRFHTERPPDPAVSPDGRLLAFAVGPLSSSRVTLLSTVDGSSSTLSLGMPAFRASFSPDGRRLAFMGFVDGSWEVMVARRGVWRARQLTSGGGRKGWPVFSPDGLRIAFVKGKVGDESIVSLGLHDGSRTSVKVPGRYAALAEWTRAGLFKIKGYSRRERRLRVRVFNPGRIELRGEGVGRTSKVTKVRGVVSVPVKWRAGHRRSLIEIEFKPVGVLPGQKRLRIQR